MTSPTTTTAPATGTGGDAVLRPIGGLSGSVGADRRFSLAWHLDPAYAAYEVHESTDDPAKTLKDTVAAPPRTSSPLMARNTPLRYGVRGRTASGDLGPFGAAVEVLVRTSGGTVTVTGETFTLPVAPHVSRVITDPAPRFPGDLIPTHWKLTTTLRDAAEDDHHQPLEVYRDGRTKIDGRSVALGSYVDATRWRLTDEQGRWGIKITCPSEGESTPHSPNKRWELRGMTATGSDETEFDLTDDAPILDTELCVLDLQGNAAVLSQIHGQVVEHGTLKNDDLTVWRAEPNEDGHTYSLWVTKRDDAHGGVLVDATVKYGQVIRFGFRPAKRRVHYVYDGRPLDYSMPDDVSTVNFYRAGLYLQVKNHHTEGTIILYGARISAG